MKKRAAFASSRAGPAEPDVASNKTYRVLVETMRAGAATVSAEGHVLYANPQMARLLAVPLDELVGKPFRDLVAFEDRLTFDGLFDLAADRASEGELALVQEHRRVPVHLSLCPADTYDDLVVCLVATDLSQQKRSDDMLASERLARSIIEQIPEVVVVCDATGRIARVSEAIRRFTDQNLLLRPFAQAFPFAGVDAVLADAAAGKRTEGLALAIEDDRNDGRMRYLLANFAPFRDHEGRSLGCVVAMTDVTAMKATEATLHEAVRARDDLLATAANELRTPVASLQVQVDSLTEIVRTENITSSKGELGTKLAVTARLSERLSALTDALLDVARLTSGKLSVNDEPLDLRDVVQDVVTRIRPAAVRAACTIKIDTPKTPVVGHWDRARIEQVLMNLLGNAIKYGGKKPIAIKVKDDGASVQVLVRDRGIGIAPGDAERIFDRFEPSSERGPERAVPSDQYSGLGLGLFVARQVVESYGGSITVDGHVGPGAAFVVSLPKQRRSS